MTLLIVAAAALIALFVTVGVNHERYRRRLAVEVRALMAAPLLKRHLLAAPELPPIVERYRRIAIDGRAPVRTLRLRHRGTFRLSPTATPRPIRGELAIARWVMENSPGELPRCPSKRGLTCSMRSGSRSNTLLSKKIWPTVR